MKLANINPKHKEIINEYFNNGFNGTRAALKVDNSLNYNAAARLSHLVLNKKENKAYIRTLQHELKEGAMVTPAMIANELKGIATANITDLLGLSEAEIKQLNPTAQRAIKKISNRVKVYTNKDGSQTKEVTTHYEMHDKLKALDYLSKSIGFYEAHNAQRSVNINLNKLDVHSLNNVLNLITEDNTATQADIPQIEPTATN